MHKTVNNLTVTCKHTHPHSHTHTCTKSFIILLLAAISISSALSAPTRNAIPEGLAYPLSLQLLSISSPGQAPSLPTSSFTTLMLGHLIFFSFFFLSMSHSLFFLYLYCEGKDKLNINVPLFLAPSGFPSPLLAGCRKEAGGLLFVHLK